MATSNGTDTESTTSPDEAARLFFTDKAWRERFEARCENQREAARSEAEEMIREGQERLAALADSSGKWLAPKPLKKTNGKAAPAPKGKPKANTSSTDALDCIRGAGKDGIGTVALSKVLGTAAGPVVRPLIDAGKVRSTGKKRGMTFFAV